MAAQGLGPRAKDDLVPAYLRWLRDQCAPLRLQAIDQGAAKPSQRPLGLTSVYVDLNTEKRIPKNQTLAEAVAEERQVRPPHGRPDTPSAERELRAVPVLEILALHPKTVLLGRPVPANPR